MEDNKKWEIDGESLTIKIYDKLSNNEIYKIFTTVTNYERENVADYFTKYSYWTIENITKNKE